MMMLFELIHEWLIEEQGHEFNFDEWWLELNILNPHIEYVVVW